MSDVTPSDNDTPNTPTKMTIRRWSIEPSWQLADLLADLPPVNEHLVVKNGNCQICWQIYPQIIYMPWMYCWQPSLDSSRKPPGNFSIYFWIIRVVNSQLGNCTVMSDDTSNTKMALDRSTPEQFLITTETSTCQELWQLTVTLIAWPD